MVQVRNCLYVFVHWYKTWLSWILPGINPTSLSGANVGVFAAFGFGESDPYYHCNIAKSMFMIGFARCMGPNRVSFALNLSGD